MTTVAEALREAAGRLEVASDTARLDAEVLMAHALKATRSEMLLRQQSAPMPAGFEALVERRMKHEPVAYIRGRQEFYGRDLFVTPDVLIPRADSETTLEAALSVCPSDARILDCGTGSGALLLTALAERPGTTGVGIDRSPEALAVAADNAERWGLTGRCDLVLADWDQPGWADRFGTFDLVIANPPYVEQAADLAPSVRDFEPTGALFAGEEGLDAYRVLLPQIPSLLAPEGAAVLEIGAAQAESVSEIAANHGFSSELHRDLADRPRALVLRLRTWQSKPE